MYRPAFNGAGEAVELVLGIAQLRISCHASGSTLSGEAQFDQGPAAF